MGLSGVKIGLDGQDQVEADRSGLRVLEEVL